MSNLSFLSTQEECVSRFHSFTVLRYRLYAIGDLKSVNESDFMKRLIASRAYSHQRLAHASQGEHGPFDIALLKPSHYKEVSEDDLRRVLTERLSPNGVTSNDVLPNREITNHRLDALLQEATERAWRCYRLTLPLNDERYWSDSHREVRILEHFEEWIIVSLDFGEVQMIQLIRD